MHNKSNISNSIVETIDIKDDMEKLIPLINVCYEKEKIRVKSTDINQWMNRETYREELWVKIVVDGKLIARGIAEIESEAK